MFIPLIISSGGSSRSQAASPVIRALAVGEVHVRDWWQIMRREIVSGLALGSILGACAFIVAILFSVFRFRGNHGIFSMHHLLVSFTVGTSLVGVVLFGTLA